MKMKRLLRTQWSTLIIVLLTFLFFGIVGCTAKQTQPTASSSEWKPIQSIDFIILQGPGGGYDMWGRQTAKNMEKHLGVSIVPKNISGSGGTVALETLTRSKPDGYTIGIVDLPGMMTIEYILNPAYKVKEFVPLGMMNVAPLSIFVAANSPYDTLEDLINAAKNQEIRVGTSGLASALWQSAVVFAEEAGMKISPVAGYGSGGELMVALQAGDFVAAFVPSSTAADGLKRGSIRGLAVAGSEPDGLMPDVPLFVDLGYPKTAQFAVAYRTVLAPPGTPKEVAAVLENALIQATKESEFQEWGAGLGTKVISIDGSTTAKKIAGMEALALEFKDVLSQYLK